MDVCPIREGTGVFSGGEKSGKSPLRMKENTRKQ